MRKSTHKGQTPKLQIVSKMNRAALEAQPMLTPNPQSGLPLLTMIGQARQTKRPDHRLRGIGGHRLDVLQRLLDDTRIGRACVFKVLRATQVMHLPVTPIEARGV